MLDYVIATAFVLVPFMVFSFEIIHRGHHYGLIVAAVALIGSQIKNVWLRLFMLWACAWQAWLYINHMLSGDVFDRAAKLHAAAAGQRDIFWLIIGAAIYLAAARSKKPLYWFYNVFCAAVLFQTILGIIQSYGFHPAFWVLNKIVPALDGIHVFKYSKGSPTGMLGNPNFFGGFIAIGTVFILRGKAILWLFVIAVSMVLAKTTTAACGLVVGLAVYYAVSQRQLLVYVVGAVIVTIIFIWLVDHQNPLLDTVRWKAWRSTFEAIKATPSTMIFGSGPNARNVWDLKSPMHNEWLTAWYYYGLVGLSLFIGYVIDVWQFAWEKNRTLLAAFVTACVVCLGLQVMHLAPTGTFILIIMGLIERERTWQTF